MTEAVLHQARLFFIALQFLTRWPTPAWVGFEPSWLNASARYFPLVGTVVGLVAGGVIWAAGWLFPPIVAAGLSIMATLLLTGAFHEDGLADTCDALGGAVGRERALEIMKDSRIGSYGAVGLVAVLGLKAATLGSLLPVSAVLASIVAHTVSRAVPVLLIRILPYAGSLAQAKAKPLAQGVSAVDVAVAVGWSALVCIGCAGMAADWVGANLAMTNLAMASRAMANLPMTNPATVSLAMADPATANRAALLAAAVTALGAALLTVASARWLRRRLGGYTGDTLGAVQQVGELLVLLIWLGALRWPLSA